MDRPPATLNWGWAATVVLFGAVQLLLFAFSAHRVLVLRRSARARRRPVSPPVAPAEWPRVTLQLPIYNERMVVERLIDAAAALEYPSDRLEIQVLDDSTDDTCDAATLRVKQWRARGVAIERLHRQ